METDPHSFHAPGDLGFFFPGSASLALVFVLPDVAPHSCSDSASVSVVCNLIALRSEESFKCRMHIT